ncbi:hypothetical protein OH77DRAFT_524043 [Trametes cingulata]|nr:hypothetical protein OH77DRAFT_524043 [Trametes cingulata]
MHHKNSPVRAELPTQIRCNETRPLTKHGRIARGGSSPSSATALCAVREGEAEKTCMDSTATVCELRCLGLAFDTPDVAARACIVGWHDADSHVPADVTTGLARLVARFLRGGSSATATLSPECLDAKPRQANRHRRLHLVSRSPGRHNDVSCRATVTIERTIRRGRCSVSCFNEVCSTRKPGAQRPVEVSWKPRSPEVREWT